MSAISELIMYFIYAVLLIASISFLVLAWLSSSNKLKVFYSIIGLISIALFVTILLSNNHQFRKSELEYVGTYDLDKYPNCKNCTLELKEDNTFVVLNYNLTVEKGDWHYEAGGDYFIVYLNGNKYQLNSGRFSYFNSNN